MSIEMLESKNKRYVSNKGCESLIINTVYWNAYLKTKKITLYQVYAKQSKYYNMDWLIDVYSQLRCPTHIVLCFCLVFPRLMWPVLLVSLDCPFLIVPSVFSNVYLGITSVYRSAIITKTTFSTDILSIMQNEIDKREYWIAISNLANGKPL